MRYRARFTKVPDVGPLKGMEIHNQTVRFPTLRAAQKWQRGARRNRTLRNIRIEAVLAAAPEGRI